MRRRECCGIFGFGVRNAFYESFMAFNVETPAQSNTLSPPHTHSGCHLALTLCGTGVTQSTPTSGLAGVRLDGRCHKRDKDRGAGGMGGDARQRSTPLPLLPHSWMRNLLTRQQRISSWPNPCRAWLSLSAAHEIFAAERRKKKEKVCGNFTKQQSCRCILIYVLLRAG